jgi:hypothetical protein
VFVTVCKSFTAAYKDKEGKDNVVNCSATERDPSKKEVCLFDVKSIEGGACNPENEFGYRNGTPCVLLKVNKVSDQLTGTLSVDDEWFVPQYKNKLHQ